MSHVIWVPGCTALPLALSRIPFPHPSLLSFGNLISLLSIHKYGALVCTKIILKFFFRSEWIGLMNTLSPIGVFDRKTISNDATTLLHHLSYINDLQTTGIFECLQLVVSTLPFSGFNVHFIVLICMFQYIRWNQM